MKLKSCLISQLHTEYSTRCSNFLIKIYCQHPYLLDTLFSPHSIYICNFPFGSYQVFFQRQRVPKLINCIQTLPCFCWKPVLMFSDLVLQVYANHHCCLPSASMSPYPLIRFQVERWQPQTTPTATSVFSPADNQGPDG